MNEVQMGKSIGHLTKSRFWMVQMAAAAPEHVLIRVQGKPIGTALPRNDCTAKD